MSPTIADLLETQDPAELDAAGREMHALATELFPICRSITGDGVRATLRRLQEDLPLELHEVPTGTEVFDWTVPREWNIRAAWIQDPHGQRIVDFADSTLHVLNYSQPIRRTMSLEELRPHLHSLPAQPEAIPYKTSYYRETWGFCLRHAQLGSLAGGEYEVCIDSTLEDGHLTYGEMLLPGRRPAEILFSAHVCHPSLANDNLSAVVVLHRLAQLLSMVDRELSYRFVFAPGTIGAITWLARNRDRLDRIRGGLVVAGVGDAGPFTYKRTRRGDADIDLLVQRALRESGESHQLVAFSPDGYDERQYGSPGIDLPVGRLSRTPYGTYPEYHTSLDDLDFIHPDSLAGALAALLRICRLTEQSRRYRNRSPLCEPQLGRRGLYSAFGGHRDSSQRERAMLWVLSFSDGAHSLTDIAERSGLPAELLEEVARVLVDHQLLSPLDEA